MAGGAAALVVGLACRLAPDIDTPTQLVGFLAKRSCGLQPLPTDRYPEPKPVWGGCRQSDPRGFDHRFFKIAATDAADMDPQQAMALEVVYEALQDAGLSLAAVRGRDVGVFVGNGLPEHGVHLAATGATHNSHAGVIQAHYMCSIANKISYFFDWHGPSLSLDTACSSSLTALHTAMESLACGSCSMAVVVGTNVMLSPWLLDAIVAGGVLSHTGTSAPFDARGDGYTRAEGAVAIVLLPHGSDAGSGARAAPFRAYARVAATGVSADGWKRSRYAPSSEEQQRLIRLVHQRGGVPLEAVSYVEAHGTGTPVGDPIEATTLAQVYRPQAAASQLPPLAIGSIKGNIGHTESASGLCGLIKGCLMLFTGSMLPTAGWQRWRPNIEASVSQRLRVVTEVEPLVPAPGLSAAYVGVSSYGLGGSNAYALLAGADTASPAQRLLVGPSLLLPWPQQGLRSAGPPLLGTYVLPLATHSPRLLPGYAERWQALCAKLVRTGNSDGAPDAARLSALAFDGAARCHVQAACHTLGARAVLLGTVTSLPDSSPLEAAVTATDGTAPAVGLVFGGQGTHKPGMGSELWVHMPAFQDAVREFAACYADVGGCALLSETDGGAGVSVAAEVPWHPLVASALSAAADASVELVLPAIMAVQYGQWRLLREVGVAVTVVAGHSAGEIMAALAAQALDLRRACCLVLARCTALAAMPPGRMAAVRSTRASLDQALSDSGLTGLVEVAAFNAPGHVTVSGMQEAIVQLAADPRLQCVQLNVRHAYHSATVSSVLPLFSRTLAGCGWTDSAAGSGEASSALRSPELVSTVTGGPVGDAAQLQQHVHWLASLRQPVMFEQAVAQLQQRCGIVLELGPSAALGSYIRAAAPLLPLRALTRNPATQLHDTLEALAQVWLAGGQVHWERLLHPADAGTWFPTMPWARSTSLVRSQTAVPMPAVASGARMARRTSVPVPAALGGGASSAAVLPRQQPPAERAAAPAPSPAALTSGTNSMLPCSIPTHFGDHRIGGRPLVPLAAYVCYALRYAAAQSGGGSGAHTAAAEQLVVVRDLEVLRPHICSRATAGQAERLRLRASGGQQGGGSLQFCGDGAGAQPALARTHTTGAGGAAEVAQSTLVPLLQMVAAGAEVPAHSGQPTALQGVSVQHFYRYLRDLSPFAYGPAFQGITGLSVADGSAVASVVLPPAAQDASGGGEALDGAPPSGVLRAALVDCCLQVALAASPMPTKEHYMLPVGAKRVVAWPAALALSPVGASLRAVARVETPGVLVQRPVYSVLLATSEGSPLLLVEGLRLKAAAAPARPSWRFTQTWWQRATDPTAPAPAAGAVVWLGPPALMAQLWPADRAAQDVVASPENALPHLPVSVRAVVACCGVDEGARLLRELSPTTPLLLLCLPPHSMETHRMLGFARAARLEQRSRRVQCLVVGSDSVAPMAAVGQLCLQLITGADCEPEVVLTPLGAHVPRLTPLELPGADAASPDAQAANARASAAQAPPSALAAASAGAAAGLPAQGLVPRAARPTPDWVVVVHKPGQLSSLGFQRLEAPATLQPWEVEVETAGVALNFKDVMTALGMLPGFPPNLGHELSGTITALGAGVAATHPHLRVGSRVLGASHPLRNQRPADRHPTAASRVVMPADQAFLVPAHVPLVEAAAYGVVASTVYYALVARADLREGETVLIHSAMGGVGQAALRLAQHLGARIVASAGSAAKRARLAGEPGVVAVLDSRDPATFKPGVDAATGGRGVDVLLNSLSGEAQVASLQLMAPLGRFVEIGKRDLLANSPLPQQALLENVSFLSVHIDLLATHSWPLFMQMCEKGLDIMWRAPRRLDVTVFPIPDVEIALRTMARAQHTGKLVLEVPPGWAPAGLAGTPALTVPPAPKPNDTAASDSPAQLMEEAASPHDAGQAEAAGAAPAVAGSPLAAGTVLVTGGTAGVGLAAVERLVHCGAAKRLLLLSSRGESGVGEHARAALGAFRQAGASVEVVQCDIADAAQLSRALAMLPAAHPVTAVLHFAAQYEFDHASQPLPLDSAAYTVKLGGALALHAVTAALPAVREFLLISSIGRVTGWPKSAAYIMANQGLAGLVGHRLALGLPAKLLDLPSVAGAGRLARWPNVKEALLANATMGVRPVHVGVVAERIAALLLHGQQGTLATMFDTSLMEHLPASLPMPIFTRVKTAGAASDASPAPLAQLVLLPPGTICLPMDATITSASAPAPTAAAVGDAASSVVPMPPAAAAPAAAAVRGAILAKLCALLGCAPGDVGDATPLSDLGLDSLAAVELSNWMQEKYGTTGMPAGSDAADAGEQLGTEVCLSQLVAAASATSAHASAAAAPASVRAQPPASPLARGAAPAAASASAPTPTAAAASSVVPMPPATAAPAAAAVRGAILAKLCALLGCAPGDVGDATPLSDLGLDSLAAVELSNWMQEKYGTTGMPAGSDPDAADAGEQLGTEVCLSQLVAAASATSAHASVAAAPASVRAQPPAPPLPRGAAPAAASAIAPTPTAAAASSVVPMPPAAAAPAAAAVRGAILAKLCALLGCAPGDVGDATPLSDLGLDSLAAVELSNWMQEQYGVTGMPAGSDAADAGEQLGTEVCLSQLVAAASATSAHASVAAAPASVRAQPPAPPLPRGAAPAAASAIAPTPTAAAASSVVPMPPAAAAPAAAAVRGAILAKLCALLGCAPGDVGDATPLSDLGLDSLAAVELSNWMQEQYGTTGMPAGSDAADAGEQLGTEVCLSQLVAAASATSAHASVAAAPASVRAQPPAPPLPRGAAPAAASAIAPTPTAAAASSVVPMPPAAAAPAAAAIRGAILAKLCALLGCAPGDVGDATPLSDLGLDSLAAVELSNWMQEQYGTTGMPAGSDPDAADAGEQLGTEVCLGQLVAAASAMSAHVSAAAAPASVRAQPLAPPLPLGAAALSASSSAPAPTGAAVGDAAGSVMPMPPSAAAPVAAAVRGTILMAAAAHTATVAAVGGLRQPHNARHTADLSSSDSSDPFDQLAAHNSPFWAGVATGANAAPTTDAAAPPTLSAAPVAGEAAPPTTPDGEGGRLAGIHAMECYLPANAIATPVLEAAGKVYPGKFGRMGLHEMCHPGVHEDAVSMAMTAVARLLERHGVPPAHIGRLDVGTESPVDLCKSIKSHLMQLFVKEGAPEPAFVDMEGADSIGACHASTAALLNSLAWVESEGWDGRYGVVVAVDMAAINVGGMAFGAAAVAMLVGADAPLVVDPLRFSTSGHSYDFWKPLGLLPSYAHLTPEGMDACPHTVVKGKHSLECYIAAQARCHAGLCRVRGWDHVLSRCDYYVQHSTSTYWSQTAFAALAESLPGGATTPQARQALFEAKAGAANAAAQRIGPTYTASLYVALLSMLSVEGTAAVGKTACLFAYGSGLAATMLTARIRRLPRHTSVFAAMHGRVLMPWERFSGLVRAHHALQMQLGTTALPLEGDAAGILLPGTFCVTGIDKLGQRSYKRVQPDGAAASTPGADGAPPPLGPATLSLSSIGLPQLTESLPVPSTPVAPRAGRPAAQLRGSTSSPWQLDPIGTARASPAGLQASTGGFLTVGDSEGALRIAPPTLDRGLGAATSLRRGVSGGAAAAVLVQADELGRWLAITLQRAALDSTMLSALHRAFASAADRVVVVSSAVPGVFNDGWDLQALSPTAGGGADNPQALSDGLVAFAELAGLLDARTQPLVCLVEGRAAGGGLLLLGKADVVVATPGASFALPEIRRGVLPGIVSAALAERLSRKVIQRLAITGDALSAADARACGLVDTLCQTPGAAGQEVQRLLRRLCSTPAPLRALALQRLPAASEQEGLVLMGELLLPSQQQQQQQASVDAVLVSYPSDGVAVLELNMPSTGNAMTLEWAAALNAALDQLQARVATLSAVVLHGRGSHFCTGMSLPLARRLQRQPLLSNVASTVAISRAVCRLSQLPVAVLAVVHGSVLGGGVALALHADWRCASEDATLSYGNLSRGTSPLFALPEKLVQTVGRPAALQLYLSDAEVTASDALRVGLVQEVCVDKAAALARALEFGREIASHQRLGLQHTLALYRSPMDEAVLAAEAVKAAVCLNAGSFVGMMPSGGAATLDSSVPSAAVGGGSIYNRAGAPNGTEADRADSSSSEAGVPARAWDAQQWLKSARAPVQLALRARMEMLTRGGGAALSLLQRQQQQGSAAVPHSDPNDLFSRASAHAAMLRASREAGVNGLFPTTISSNSESRMCVMALEGQGAPRPVLNAGSMDYLGLAQHPEVVHAITSAVEEHGSSLTNSRVLCGNGAIHEELEQELASFFGKEACMVLPAGWLACAAAIKGLTRATDVIFIDALAHDSLAAGARLSDAKVLQFKSSEHLASLLAGQRSQYAGALIVTEHTFSVDGARADVQRFRRLADSHGCRLVVDVAHSLGTCSRLVSEVAAADIVVGTFSKSLVSQGGYVAGPADVVELLGVTGMPFTANLAIASAAAALAALRVLRREPTRVERLEANVALLRGELRARGCSVAADGGPLLHVVAGGGRDEHALMLWKWAWEAGVYCHPALFPMTGLGNAGVRITLGAGMGRVSVLRIAEVIASGVRFANHAK